MVALEKKKSQSVYIIGSDLVLKRPYVIIELQLQTAKGVLA